MLQQGEFTNKDVIFFEDMFTPGIESLAYIFAQTPPQFQPAVYVRCLAQSIDPDDFVIREDMIGFMRPFELMVDSFVTAILVASEEMVSHLRIAGFKSPIFVTGLPFGKAEVLSRVPALTPWYQRPTRVAFAARWDPEKQPKFFMEVIRRTRVLDPTIEFELLSGNDTLKSSAPELVQLALKLAQDFPKTFAIHTGLTKNEYYARLANSRVLFNCALQDWVSNTVSEADTFGCQTLYPAYRSFPEVFGNDMRHMYLPWSVDDAVDKLIKLVRANQQLVGRVSSYQDKTIDRTIDVFENLESAKETLRDTTSFRSHLTRSKL